MNVVRTIAGAAPAGSLAGFLGFGMSDRIASICLYVETYLCVVGDAQVSPALIGRGMGLSALSV
jgi:hypothetical protein